MISISAGFLLKTRMLWLNDWEPEALNSDARAFLVKEFSHLTSQPPIVHPFAGQSADTSKSHRVGLSTASITSSIVSTAEAGPSSLGSWLFTNQEKLFSLVCYFVVFK